VDPCPCFCDCFANCLCALPPEEENVKVNVANKLAYRVF
jgi:hypothetical protein